MEKEWKDWITESIIADRLLYSGPCFVKYVSLQSGSTGTGIVVIYDGHDTTGKIKYRFFVDVKNLKSVNFSIPIYYDKGLYVDIGTNVLLFTIQYKPAEMK